MSYKQYLTLDILDVIIMRNKSSGEKAVFGVDNRVIKK